METTYNYSDSLQFNKRKPKSCEDESFEVGGTNASLTKEVIKKHKMESALKRFANQLVEQMDCDGIILNNITFQRVWFKQNKYR